MRRFVVIIGLWACLVPLVGWVPSVGKTATTVAISAPPNPMPAWARSGKPSDGR